MKTEQRTKLSELEREIFDADLGNTGAAIEALHEYEKECGVYSPHSPVPRWCNPLTETEQLHRLRRRNQLRGWIATGIILTLCTVAAVAVVWIFLTAINPATP